MKITIEIPKEFEKDFTDDKFNDFFERISADLEYVVCGRYEKEALKMMHHAFYDAQDVSGINSGVMERLTYKLGNSYGLNDEASSKVGLFTDYDGFFSYLKAVNKLGRYEDLAEQGRLLELPCKVGDTVYGITVKKKGSNIPTRTFPLRVKGVKFDSSEMYLHLYSNINEENYSIWWDNWYNTRDVGIIYFMTKSEAEQALAERQG